ncbi:NAD(P)/FAD-dependent oxidoreductase [Dictyobacter arantiisoli]|uniref:Digeranylgeranylglycerophospholipid reductase n=1 Tax=Dictyobacter arantiisoli TaxID=2014874 RepID=A0A5A5TDX7_9CHLR|nr:NAD(P)/FAD-dependent oxidoreductase [Dictyobacter arantiisoli]GCF09751.1 digeranylgeranylglycerophospholipid reductase [Dictyobacter arantiisoli]
MSDDYNVLVVGGGPAGLAAAEAAAKQGVRTLVLERQKEIGYPIHTSGGTWVKDMQALKIPAHLYHPVKTVYFISPHREAAFHYTPEVVCVVDIRGLYQHLASRAVAAGAEVRVKHTVEQTLFEDGRILGVTAKDHLSERITVRADVTIDASGFSRHIGVRTDMGDAFKRYGFGAEYDLYAPNYPQDEIFLLVGSEWAPNCYAWIFPHGEGRVRVGTGVIHPDNDKDARLYLDRIIHDIPRLEGHFKGASPLEFHTGLFPSEGALPRFSRDGLLLAGDSGGHGSTLVGEGIRFAIYSGQMAGETAAEAIKAGDTSEAYLARFDQRWRSRFGRDMDIAYMINKHIAAYSDAQWDGSIDLLKRLTPAQAAQALRGDFNASLVMGILARNPSLIATGGKRFLDKMLERINKPAGVHA